MFWVSYEKYALYFMNGRVEIIDSQIEQLTAMHYRCSIVFSDIQQVIS